MNCTKAILPFSSITNDQLHLVNTGNTISPTQHDSLNLSPDHNIQNLINELNNLSDNNSHADENENCRYYSLEELNKVKQSNKKQHLNSLHLNIQSLFAHIDELKTLLTYCKKTNFDLIGITESRQKM